MPFCLKNKALKNKKIKNKQTNKQNKNKAYGDFPGGPVIKVPSLIGELGSHMLCSMDKVFFF